MKYKLAYYGNPILRKKCTPVDPIDNNIAAIIDEMREIMYKHNGMGLAAPQIGLDIALFIMEVPQENEKEYDAEKAIFRHFINPKILSISDEQNIVAEGCLSIPGIREEVVRPSKVDVEAQDLEGNIFRISLDGLEARCFLHENDHINGVLFIDRLPRQVRQSLKKQLNDIKKKYSK